MQRKLCSTLTDKENLVKDLARLKEKYNQKLELNGGGTESDQIAMLKSSIKKKSDEVESLNKTLSETQSINLFLTTQITNLNEQIFELTNESKENANNVSFGQREMKSKSSASKLFNKSPPSQLGSNGANRSFGTTVLQNQSFNLNSSDAGFENSANISSRKRQLNQCAQQ